MTKSLLFITLGLVSTVSGLYILFTSHSPLPTKSSTLGASAAAAPGLAGKPTSPTATPRLSTLLPNYLSTFRVLRVIDGDTIQLENGQTVRYIGIDTPETVHPDKPVECYGKEASDKNKELVLGKNIKLEKDISETDKYGRLLAYVWVENTMVNDHLVRQGFAHSSSYPPDIKYQQQFVEAEREARENSRGLWANDACSSTESVKSEQISGICGIKGNISSSGEKIYHTPGQKYYDKTQIDETKGEKYFCSEEDAQNAGWRKSKI